jgi:hypothetical protein
MHDLLLLRRRRCAYARDSSSDCDHGDGGRATDCAKTSACGAAVTTRDCSRRCDSTGRWQSCRFGCADGSHDCHCADRDCDCADTSAEGEAAAEAEGAAALDAAGTMGVAERTDPPVRLCVRASDCHAGPSFARGGVG